MRTRWEYYAKGLKYHFKNIAIGSSSPRKGIDPHPTLTINPLPGIAEAARGIALTIEPRSVAESHSFGSVALCNGGISVAWAKGPESIACHRGNFGFASAGHNGVAYGGYHCAAKAGEGGIIILKGFKEGIIKLFVGVIGQDGLKPDTWYRVGRDGAFVEAPENPSKDDEDVD